MPFVTQQLDGAPVRWSRSATGCGPCPTRSRSGCPATGTSLGTDGFGRSDTRPALRRHFQVDAESIVVATLIELARRGEVKADAPQRRSRSTRPSSSAPRRRRAQTITPAPRPTSTPRSQPSSRSCLSRPRSRTSGWPSARWRPSRPGGRWSGGWPAACCTLRADAFDGVGEERRGRGPGERRLINSCRRQRRRQHRCRGRSDELRPCHRVLLESRLCSRNARSRPVLCLCSSRTGVSRSRRQPGRRPPWAARQRQATARWSTISSSTRTKVWSGRAQHAREEWKEAEPVRRGPAGRRPRPSGNLTGGDAGGNGAGRRQGRPSSRLHRQGLSDGPPPTLAVWPTCSSGVSTCWNAEDAAIPMNSSATPGCTR